MRWLNLLIALALDGANRRVDQPEVPIDSMSKDYWIGIA